MLSAILLTVGLFGQKAVITDRHGNPPPSEIPAGEVIYFSAAKSEKGVACVPLWLVSPPERRARSEKFEGGTLLVVPAGIEECLLTVTLVVAKADAPAIETVTVRIVGRQPQPPDPPKPPDPPPVPVPTGFRVLLVYESGANQTREQLNILNSTKISAYLNEKCAKDGNQPGWRRWDKDIDVSKENQTMRRLWDAVKPKLQSLPALVIATDTTADAMPLPATESETLTMLKSKGN